MGVRRRPRCRSSARLALEQRVPGAEAFLVAADDTCMTQTNAELMAEFYPDVPVRSELSDHEVLLSITKACRMFGYEPSHSWWALSPPHLRFGPRCLTASVIFIH
jgi:hypothetical protein